MNELHHALGDIGRIRRHLAQNTEFRGYGPATMAGTGVASLLAAAAQSHWIPDPAAHIGQYLALWIGTAVVTSTLAGLQMVTRSRRMHSGLSNDMLRTAVEQFLPAAGAGILLTVVLVHSVPTAAWMLPALWQIIYALGVFSAARSLPRLMPVAGAWYLVTGLAWLSFGDTRALGPWTMGFAYGAGQMLVGGILYIAGGSAETEGDSSDEE